MTVAPKTKGRKKGGGFLGGGDERRQEQEAREETAALACARAAGGSALGGGQRTACAAVTHALSTLQLQFAARMQGARDASAGSEAMRAHCHANRKEKRRCRGSDSRQKPKIKHAVHCP